MVDNYTYPKQDIDWENIKELGSLKAIEKEIKDRIHKEELVLKSVENFIIDKVRSIYIPYDGGLMHTAWLEYIGAKEGKNSYNWVEERIKADFFNNAEGVEIIKFYSCGDVCYGYSIHVKFDGILFDIFIPDTKKADPDTIKNLENGRYVLRYTEDGNVWKRLADSYMIESIARKIEEVAKEVNY